MKLLAGYGLRGLPHISFMHDIARSTNQAQLLCKRIDASYNQEAYEVASTWCRLSLHPIFANAGSLNIGKLQR